MNNTHPTATITSQLPGSTRRAFFPSISLKTLELMMFAVFLFLAASQVKVKAQTPTPTPDSDEVKRLKEEKAQSDLRKGIAEDQKAELAAKFPKPTTTPLEGKTEVDSGVKLESEMLAYRSMAVAADRIVKDMKSNVSTISALAIHNDRDLKALMGYMVITSQLGLMKDEYDKSEVPFPPGANKTLRTSGLVPVSEGLSAAQSVLGSFIDLIALLRTDTSIKGMDFNIEESALVSEVFRALRASVTGYGAGTKLFYPAVFPPNIGVDKQFIILRRIQDLYLTRERAAKLIAEIEETEKAHGDTKDEIEGLQKKLKADKESVALLDKELERLQKIYWRWPSSRLAERIEEVSGQIAKLRDEILKLPSAIKDDKAQLEALDKRLVELYGEILPEVLQDDNVKAVNAAIGKIIISQGWLGRAFLPSELKLLFVKLPEAKKKALLAEAEAYKQRKLTDEQAEQLLAPLTSPQQSALKKIFDAQTAPGVIVDAAKLNGLTKAEKTDALTQADQMLLLSDADQAALRKLKEASLARLRALNDQFDKLKAELIKVDNGAGINALTSYLQAENLLDALGCPVAAGAGAPAGGCPNAYILQLKVVRAGGNNKTTRNLLKDVFTGPSISHSGGAIVEYNLYDIAGQSKSSNIFTIYSGYKKAKDIPASAGQN